MRKHYKYNYKKGYDQWILKYFCHSEAFEAISKTSLKLHFLGDFKTLWDVRTWLEKYLIHVDELYQSKTSKSKKLHFSFQGQSH